MSFHLGFKKIFGKVLLCFIFVSIFFPSVSYLQTRPNITDSLIVDFIEKRIGKTEITILFRDKKVFLPFNDIFDWLRIFYSYNADEKLLEGYIITEDSSFIIDFDEGKAYYKNVEFSLNSYDYILLGEKIYFDEKLFGKIFNWDIKYDEKKLEVLLKSRISFPQIQQERRQRQIQIRSEREYTEPDLYIKRQPLIFNLGKLNYNITAYTFRREDIRARYSFILGGQLLFGDFETSIKGNIKEKIKERNIRGYIKYPFFQNRILNQITIGDIQKLSFAGGNLFGIDITNIPAERRFEFSKYSITSKLSPLHEYYLTGRIVTPYYVTAKNDTVITIPTKLYYGYTQYTERIYDWYGKEKIKETYLIIPPSMIPPGELDYRLSLGKLRQKNYPMYSSLDIGYGATDYITLGTGIEYLDKRDLKGKFFPYTYTTVRLFNNIYGILEYSPFVVGRANLNYQTIEGGMVNIRVSNYVKNKVLNPRNLENSYGLGLFLPFHIQYFNNLFNFSFDRNSLANAEELFLRSGLGTYFKNINLVYNFFLSTLTSKYTVEELVEDEETNEIIIVKKDREVYVKTMQSDVSMSLAPTRFSNFNAGIRFDHINERIKSVNVGINIYLFSNIGFNLTAERDLINKQIYANFNISFNPQYVSLSANATVGSFGNIYSSGIRGEIIGSTQTFDLLFNRISQRNRGFFLSSAFLDVNNNGKRDKGEQYIENVKISTQRIFGFGAPFTKKYDRYNYLLAGELYRDYVISVRAFDLEDPFWVPKYSGIKVKTEPNKLKRIEIPIVTGGIINGLVSDENGNPIGGLSIKLSLNDKIQKTVLTNSRGEFEFPTVPPGVYKVFIDEEILLASNAVSEPAVQEIQITGEPEKNLVSTSFIVKFK